MTFETPSDNNGAPVAVVTGASSGIGRATAQELAARGMRLVLAARDPATLEEAALECKARGAGDVLTLPTDVSDAAAVERLATAAVDRMGGIEVWVNNAAVMAYGKLDDLPPEVYRQVIDINLFGAIAGSRMALRHFRSRGAGHLINIGSLYAKMTSPLVGPYVVSKFGLLGFTEVVRQEMGREPDIHISLVLPGSIDSPIFRHAANFAGRGGRPVPPVSDVRRVARAVSDLIDEPKAEVVVGNTHRMLSWGKAVFPRIYDYLAAPVMGAAGLQRHTVDSHTGNVFGSRPEWNQMRGSWSRREDLTAIGRGVAAAVGAMVESVRRRLGRSADDR